jgi:EH_Signature domain
MNELGALRALLQPGIEEGRRPMSEARGIDEVLEQLRSRCAQGASGKVPEEFQQEAVRRFWDSLLIASFRDTYLLSWGLCLPVREDGPCILEDRDRFRRVLIAVDKEKARPKAFRRCYKGLLKNYFFYDIQAQKASAIARQNWVELRGYLKLCAAAIASGVQLPDWAHAAGANKKLFTESPCDPYVPAVLAGDSTEIDRLTETLGIVKSSWFFRELILTQIKVATSSSDVKFQSHLSALVSVIATHELLQDQALTLLLNRYSEISGAQEDHALREAAVSRWKNPWLPSNAKHWGSVTAQARTMVSNWLKREFIREFFMKLAEERAGDTRRMEFWLKYARAITRIEFALGSRVRNSRDKDLIVLREKMTGLTGELDSQDNNAFIMTMGDLVAVEFSVKGNALYGYEARGSLPFDTSKRLLLNVDYPNSLKQQGAARFQLRHKDDVHGYTTWEDLFEATLREKFGIHAPEPESEEIPTARRATQAAVPQTSTPSSAYTYGGRANSATSIQQIESVPFSRQALKTYADRVGAQIVDKTSVGGNLWVYAGKDRDDVDRVLKNWGFGYKAGKGWWK